MSDLFDIISEDSFADVSKKKKGLKVVSSPVLFGSKDADYTFIVDDYLSAKQLRYFHNTLSYKGFNDYNYQILYPLKFIPKKKETENSIVKLYRDNSFPLEDYIKTGSKVLTFGRSLYSITESNDLTILGFYELLLNRTYIFSPKLKCLVYPVDSFGLSAFGDNYESKFMEIQLDNIRKEKVIPKRIPTLNKIHVENPNEFLSDYIGSYRELAIDIETNSLNPFEETSRILCVTISFDGKTGYYLDWDKIDVEILNDFLEGKGLVTANGKFDCKFFATRGIEVKNMNIVWDTVSISKVINELQKNSLKSDTWIYTLHGGYDNALEKYKEEYPACKTDYSLFPKGMLFDYATTDPIVTFQIYEAQKIEIDRMDKKYPTGNEWSIRRFVDELRIPAINYYLKVELSGIYVNIEELRAVGKILKDQIAEIKKEAYEALCVTEDQFNISSPEQLGKLIESKGWIIEDRNKKGIPKTNIDCLNKWKKDGHIEAEILVRMREKQTLFGTFIGEEKGDYSEIDLLDAMEDEEDMVEKDLGAWKYLIHHEDGSHRMHPTFGVMMTDSGTRNKVKQPNCFPREVEILTKKGWQRFDELEKGLEVAQYDQETGEIDFVKPLEYIKHMNTEDLVHITTKKQIDILCTKDHRLLLQDRKLLSFKNVEADKFLGDHRVYHSGDYKGGSISLSEYEVALVCAIQADAYLPVNPKTKKYTGAINFGFHKKRKADRIIKVFDNLGINYKLTTKDLKNGKYSYRFYTSVKCEKAKRFLNKYFDSTLLKYDRKTLEYFSKEVFFWDGNIGNNHRYYSNIKSNADWVQIIMILSGKRCKIRESTFNRKNTKYTCDTSPTKSHSSTCDFTKEYIPHNDYVYCVTMPKDTIITRYNSRVAITKNCQNFPARGEKAYLIRRIFGTPDDALYFTSGIDYAGLQLRIGAILSGDKVMTEIFKSDNDDMHSKTGQSILKRDITLEEFTRRKKEPEIKVFRDKSKNINFQLEFGASAFSFATSTIAKEWTIKEASDYVTTNELHDKVKSLRGMLNRGDEMFQGLGDRDIFAMYWAVASDIRDKFFEEYSGLKTFIDDSVSFAENYGYARSYHGMFRRLPRLYLVKSYGTPSRDFDSGLIKNLQNIAINSKVQNFEGVIVNRWMINLDKEMVERDLKTKLFTQIHDSGDYYIYKPEVREFCPLAKKIGETDYPEYNGILIKLEANISDPLKGELWDLNGQEWDEYL